MIENAVRKIASKSAKAFAPQQNCPAELINRARIFLRALHQGLRVATAPHYVYANAWHAISDDSVCARTLGCPLSSAKSRARAGRGSFAARSAPKHGAESVTLR